MNCKQGDLAIARLVPPAEQGTVVTCLELADDEYLTSLCVCRDQRPVWKVDKEFTWSRPVPYTEVKLFLVPDCCLMPISPPDNFKDDEEDTPRDLNEEALNQFVEDLRRTMRDVCS